MANQDSFGPLRLFNDLAPFLVRQPSQFRTLNRCEMERCHRIKTLLYLDGSDSSGVVGNGTFES